MKRLTWLTALGTMGLLFTACGLDSELVLARNLATGELSAFAKDEVPQDWVVCSSDECPIPPSIPCGKLSTKTCTLSPECRLQETNCQSDGCACPACAPGANCPPCDCPPPKPPVCDYTCIPKLPLLCEELGDEKACGARGDCEWGDSLCPELMYCAPGQPCPSCPKTCRTKARETCAALDQKQCEARSDCAWHYAACPAICEDDGKGGCKPCDAKGFCSPKLPVPCPTFAPPSCKGGTIVIVKDENGCDFPVCEPPKGCGDLETAYAAAVAKAKACNPFAMWPVQECGKLVDSSLSCPVCPTFVSIFATEALKEMDDLRAKWLALGCDTLELVCPTFAACQEPKSASCLPDATGSGVCTPDAP